MPKKYQVELSKTAITDIHEIWDYIATDNPIQATKFVVELEKRIYTLETHPERCPIIPENEILIGDYRHLIYGNYRSIFTIEKNIVFIIRVIHGARLLDFAILE